LNYQLFRTGLDEGPIFVDHIGTFTPTEPLNELTIICGTGTVYSWFASQGEDSYDQAAHEKYEYILSNMLRILQANDEAAGTSASG
jgi:hypothetical protein